MLGKQANIFGRNRGCVLPERLNNCALIFAAAMMLALSGCADWTLPPAKQMFGRKPQLPELPAAAETVRGEEDPPVVTLKVGNKLRERALSRSDDLPAGIKIGNINLQNVPVSSALEAVLAGTDISLAYQSENFNDRLVTLVNLSGPLPKVVHRICSAAKIFCIARDGNLELKDKQSFIIELPPVERGRTTAGTGTSTGTSTSTSSTGYSSNASSAFNTSTSLSATGAANSIVEAVSQLAGSKAEEDSAGGNLIYTTDVEGQERVSRYLEQLRNGRPLVVMQMYIWEVSLDSDSAAGINWRNLTASKFGGNFSQVSLSSADAMSAVTGGVSMGAVLSGKISAQIVANFLSTQGVVQTLSNPQLTFVSGSSAGFRVGGTRSYVSSVGQLTTTSDTVSGSSTSTSAGVGTNTVSTDKVETGLKIEVNGTYEGGVIFSTLAVSITDLIKIESISTGATTLQLPETTNRDFSTVLRVRPGDNIVLAGMTSSRDDLTRDRLNLPLADRLPLRGENKYQNRELVVLLKPSIIFFGDADTPQEEEKKAPEPPQDQPDHKDQGAAPLPPVAAQDQPPPMPAPVLVDVRQPKTAPVPALDESMPLPLVRNEAPLPEEGVVIAVDKDFLQRGFSSAFGAPMPAARRP